MEENAALSAKSLIEQENRQYNETNALYHAAAVQFGLSDTAFWILYALYSSAAPLTQVQMCAEWCLPKQTLNSAVRSMVEQGLLVLTPAPGGKRAKNLMKTDVKDTEHGYEITMNLPGVKKEDVKAALKDGYLTISATSDSKKEEKNDKGQYIRRERYTGSCSRSFYVGEDIQQEDVKAEFKHGILKLFVPKKEAKPAVEEKKHIAIEG